MKLYTIYDPDSDLYLTRGLNPRLEKLGINTRFFKDRSEAMRHIENRRHELRTTVLQNELAFWLLENLHKKDRWHLNVSYSELMDACYQFNHLEARAICLKEENRAK